jgi:beta-xylosidase
MTAATSGATTPIVAGFYPDPTVCRNADDYYLAHSSFEYFPGVPIWHSRDLLHWTQIGHVLNRPSQLARLERRGSSGLWAGTLRHHDGRFWYVTTNTSDFDAGQLIVWAEDPAGPWSDPVHVPHAYGIDPDLAWDGDQCYLTWNAWPSAQGGHGGVMQARLDIGTGRLLEPAYPVWQGSGLDVPEGPHLYEVDGFWYLLLAEGGTERGHVVTVSRGAHPWGPFTGCPSNPILTHRSSNHPVQNTGHADLVRVPDGGWAAAYLGVRPRVSTSWVERRFSPGWTGWTDGRSSSRTATRSRRRRPGSSTTSTSPTSTCGGWCRALSRQPPLSWIRPEACWSCPRRATQAMRRVRRVCCVAAYETFAGRRRRRCKAPADSCCESTTGMPTD